MTSRAPAWRLIDAGPLDGPSNMALDEALLACFNRGGFLPVLRLYGWRPSALSVGRYQDAEGSLKLDLCAAENVPVVRRMTGGGIIYHAEELTYSIVCSPEQIGEAEGVKAAFRALCGFLLETYRRLGLAPAFATDANAAGEQLGERTAFCFAGKEEYDILVGGRKIGGNAQRRMRGAILQHGSIPLENRVRDGVRYLKREAPGADQAVSLAELGVRPALTHLKQTLAASFEEMLGVRLVPSEISEEEALEATRLEVSKYRCSCWNIEGKETALLPVESLCRDAALRPPLCEGGTGGI